MIAAGPRLDEIRHALQLILSPGQVTELRALEAAFTQGDRRPGTLSGYFDDLEKMASAAVSIKQAKGIYFIPNVVKPALLARSVNKIRLMPPKGESTADGDIETRRWLLIDADPVRPAGIASDDGEHQAALDRAEQIAIALTDDGWPKPILADSGNGAHLLYRIDQPRDDDGLVQRCLEALAVQFDDAVVTIDRKVFNPARIWKLYGTMAGKGDAAAAAIGRPHRMARVLKAPSEIEVVPTYLLVALGGTQSKTGTPRSAASNGRFDLERWIRDHSLEVKGPEPWKGGRRWIFPVCPWNSDHTNESACILELESGAISAMCQHNGCHGKGWHALRDAVEPGWRERRMHAQSSSNGKHAAEDKPPYSGFRFHPIESKTFFAQDYRPRWAIKKILVAGQAAVVGGGKKSLKTSIGTDMVISLTTATSFLGQFAIDAPCRAVFLSGESGEFTLQETAKRVCVAKGVEPPSNMGWQFDLPQFSSVADMLELSRGLERDKIEVCVIDPLYLCMFSGMDASQATNLYAMGPLLRRAADACLRIGCTPVLLHHFKQGVQRERFDPPQLEDLSFSGIQEFSRQWVLLGRREQYHPGTGEHKLWLAVGGSTGHSGLWGLDIDEGTLGDDFTGRKWEVELRTFDEVKEGKQARATEKRTEKRRRDDDDDDRKVMGAVDRLDGDRKGAGVEKVRAETRLSKNRMKRAVERLVTQQQLERCTAIVEIGNDAEKECKGVRRTSGGF